MMISKKTAESCSPRNYLHSTIFLHIICFYRLSINFFSSYFQKSTFCRRFPFLRIWAGLMMSVKEPRGCWTLEANWTSKLHSFKAFWRTALRQGPAPDKYLVENFTCHKGVLKGTVKIADSAQTEYCTTFHCSSVCPSQAWHLTFLAYIKAQMPC